MNGIFPFFYGTELCALSPIANTIVNYVQKVLICFSSKLGSNIYNNSKKVRSLTQIFSSKFYFPINLYNSKDTKVTIACFYKGHNLCQTR